MAGSKKRKESAQTSTLLDFFVAPLTKKARCDESASATAPSKRAVDLIPEPKDVIVVSDDEEQIKVPSHLPGKSTSASMTHASMCGIPSVLLDKPPKPHRRVWSSNLSPYPFPNVPSGHTSCTEQAAARCDEWGTGDDEGLFQDAEDEDRVTVMDEVDATFCRGIYHKQDTVCPVCDKSLNGLLISVNDRLSLSLPKSSHDLGE